MIIGLIKSMLYMFVFYIFLRISNFILKFLYVLFYKNKTSTTDHNTDNDKNSTEIVKMLQCDECKVYISKADAYIIKNKTLCKDHKDVNNN